ncbi:unnamed protein product [Cylicocyclus nassatus]|uniref:Uncharacterized protein n=1 Tax=Cylicocyclus nassatus TaxID=53992 RepID=A0AA36H914_CYLNA|nr:unnamed protein product [Cylicocyclus nassatus]
MLANEANKFNDNVNKRYYREALGNTTTARVYSLAERYQIAENIRFCRFVARAVAWVGIWNILAAAMLFTGNLKMTIFARNVAMIGYNYIHLIYGFVMVFVMYRSDHRWRKEIGKLTKSCCATKTHSEFTSVKSTFGKETCVDKRQHAVCYFNMLNRDWEREAPTTRH